MLYLLILIIPLLIYATLSTLIIFHLKKYGIEGDFTRQLYMLFAIVSVFLIIMTTWAFFSVPWNDINIAELIQSFQNINPTVYPR